MARRVGVLVFLALACATAAVPGGSATLPPTVVWAWDRPEDLRFLPAEVGVAFLAETIDLSPALVSEKLRAHPVRINNNAPRIAVVRIQTHGGIAPEARARVTQAVLRAASLERVVGVQIDFDAKVSERAWYGDLLRDVRRGLPVATSLSMTALASWCEGDDWISGLPVDEVVPMIFRLGPERDAFRRLTQEEPGFREPLCNASVGLSTDEAVVAVGRRRVYWFSPVAWTPSEFAKTGAKR